MIDHRLSPGATVWVGVDGFWESGSVAGFVRELFDGVDSAGWFVLSEPLEPVEALGGVCSVDAEGLSDGG